jgi:hypothetical protein
MSTGPEVVGIRYSAFTVTGVLLIGFLIGLAAVYGPLGFLNDIGGPVAASFVDFGRSTVVWIIERFGVDTTATVVVVAVATVSVAMPGIVASTIVLFGRAGQQASKLGAGVCVLLAIGVVWVRRDFTSVIVAVLLLLFGLLLTLALSSLISLASGAFSALIVGAQLRIVYLNNDPSIEAAHTSLVAVFPSLDPTLLTYLLMALAVIPLISIGWSLLK